jgi:glycogen debranching enzyme
MFAVFDRLGDIELVGRGEDGLFFEGTRFLSHLSLYIGNQRPLLLSSTVREDNSLFTADLTNVDITRGDLVVIPRGTVHVTRPKTLWRGACYEQLIVSSYGLSTITIPITLHFDSDFVDLFEVRGSHRSRRGDWTMWCDGVVSVSIPNLITSRLTLANSIFRCIPNKRSFSK